MNAALRPHPDPDYLLKNGRLLNVFTGELQPANVLIGGGLILGVGPGHDGAPAVYDLDGAVILPGLIEAHLHIESSLLTPARLAEAVVPRGTTTIVADPHEIANVLGVEGVRWMLRASAGLPVDVRFMAPSCVPASPVGMGGAALDAAAVVDMLEWDGIVGLAEVMDMDGVLAGSADTMRKIRAARGLGRPIDGHAPRLSGAALNAYMAAGIESDHECVASGEAREKLRLGMRIMIREGSQARNLRDLLPVVDQTTVRRCMLVSDDRNVVDLVNDGHVDHLLRRAVALGLPPAWAVEMVTLNPADHFGLRRLGAVAPGWRADVVVVEDLREFRCLLTFKAGRLVAERGRLVAAAPATPPPGTTMNVAPLSRVALRIPGGPGRVRVIELIPDQIVTRQTITRGTSAGGEIVADPERDLAKVVVVERHHRSGRVGRGLVRGFRLRRGALAASVAHDAHQLIGIGVDDRDLLTALSEVVARGGGLAVAAGGDVQASLPLPVAGLMSDAPLVETARGLADVEAAAHALGATIDHPFVALSFLTLPVVPALRITDLGLVDVTSHRIVSLCADSGAEAPGPAAVSEVERAA